MIVTRVQEQDNNANGYIVCFFQVVSRLNVFRRIHKWCLNQLTSDILQVVLMKLANVQEIVFIDKSNKWFHTRRLFQMISYIQVVLHLHMISIIQDDGSTSDPQL